MKLEGAKHLVTASVKPQMEWGRQAHGTSPTQLRHQRRKLINALEHSFHGGCTTSSFQLLMPRGMDPAIARPVEQVKTWLQLWPKLGDNKGLVTKARASLYTQIQVAGDRWANAHSAMSGLICTLLEVDRPGRCHMGDRPRGSDGSHPGGRHCRTVCYPKTLERSCQQKHGQGSGA